MPRQQRAVQTAAPPAAPARGSLRGGGHDGPHPAPLSSTWDAAVVSVEIPPGPHHPPLVVPPPGADPVAALAPTEPVPHQPWAWKVRRVYLRGRTGLGVPQLPCGAMFSAHWVRAASCNG